VGKVTNWLLVIGHFAALSLVTGHWSFRCAVIGHWSFRCAVIGHWVIGLFFRAEFLDRERAYFLIFACAILCHQWCILTLKLAKTGEKWVFFWCKTCVFWCFLMKNEAKSVFFEAFLGLKIAFLGVFVMQNEPEMD
jgi:hypothetical protein